MFNFEPGKSYYLDYEITGGDSFFSTSSIRFFIKDLTDPPLLERAQNAMVKHAAEIEEKKAKRRAFLEYQKANQYPFEGRWSGETKRLMNTFYIQYTFAGNTMTYEGKSKHAGMRPYVMEGPFIFSEDILIFTPEKVTDNGKVIENFKTKYAWYYTMSGNILHLEGGGTAGGAIIWETDGEFHKGK
jgi:hypothetical protein